MNNNAFSHYQSNFEIIKKLCLPLTEYLGVNNFGYLKIYKNSQYFYLSNDLELTKDYLFNVHSSNIFFKETLYKNTHDSNIYYVLWPEKPENFSMNLYMKHNYWDGLTVLKVNENDIEMWWFASKKENNCAQLFYKKKIDVLLNFINYFNYEAQNIIQTNHNHLALYKSGFDFNLPNNDEKYAQEQANIKAFLNQLYPKGLIIKSKNGVIKLTHMEINCMRLLVKCNSAKEIAKQLNISNRTVEGHIDHIRKKTGYNLKTDIIKVFNDQVGSLIDGI